MDELLVKAIMADRYRKAEAARLAASFRQNRPQRRRLRDLLRELRERQGPPRPIAPTGTLPTISALDPATKTSRA